MNLRAGTILTIAVLVIAGVVILILTSIYSCNKVEQRKIWADYWHTDSVANAFATNTMTQIMSMNLKIQAAEVRNDRLKECHCGMGVPMD